MINVKNQAYGAVGDGSHDDSGAFLSAFNRLKEYAGQKVGTVFAPAGIYKLDKSLDFNGAFILAGEGKGATRLVYEGDSYALGINALSNGKTSHGWVIRDLTIDGQYEGAYGIRVGHQGPAKPNSPRSGGGRMDNVVITQFQKAALHAVCMGGASTFINCSFNGGRGPNLGGKWTGKGIGIHFDSLPFDKPRTKNKMGYTTNNLCSLSSCHFDKNYRGIVIDCLNQASFDECIFENNLQEAVLARWSAKKNRGAKRIRFNNCWWEHNCIQSSKNKTGVIRFDSSDGSCPRRNSRVFVGGVFSRAENDNYHLWLADGGGFVVMFPTFTKPSPPRGGILKVRAPTFRSGKKKAIGKTRVWWQDWKGWTPSPSARFPAWDIGTHAEIYQLVATPVSGPLTPADRIFCWSVEPIP